MPGLTPADIHNRALNAFSRRPRLYAAGSRRRASRGCAQGPAITPQSPIQPRETLDSIAFLRHSIPASSGLGRPPPGTTGFPEYRLAEPFLPRVCRLCRDGGVSARAQISEDNRDPETYGNPLCGSVAMEMPPLLDRRRIDRARFRGQAYPERFQGLSSSAHALRSVACRNAGLSGSSSTWLNRRCSSGAGPLCNINPFPVQRGFREMR